MSKRIIFCADGTWDDDSKHTNVYKFYKALTTSSEQLPNYSDGVGADGNPIIRLLGGAFGTGLWQKIKDGYTKVAHAYEQGDSVYLFGFSRGAYTVRALAGMIAACGLPTKDFSQDVVNTAWDAYRATDAAQRQNILAKLKNANMFAAEVTMIGVWDTVGAVGIPSVFGGVDPILYGFLNTSLNPKIRHAYQALAIDERREQFHPTLWEPAVGTGQTVEQVWFSGVHSDIGGGEPQAGAESTALSDLTLGWMMTKASALGLTFDMDVFKSYTVPLRAELSLDTLHNSWTIVNGIPLPRKIPDNAVIANSVALRLQHDSSYRPDNLAIENGVLSKSYAAADIVAIVEAAAAGR